LFNLCFYFLLDVAAYNISTFAAIINNFAWDLIGLSLLAALSPINKTREAFVRGWLHMRAIEIMTNHCLLLVLLFENAQVANLY
jgi:hypothetical protein